jgi:NAD-dependent SIR2 family protein deacetylase
MKMSKKVYIFGAGASAAVGLPIQNNILKEIFSVSRVSNKIDFFNTQNTLETMLISQYPNFEESRRILADFIINIFGSHSLVDYYYKEFPHSNNPKDKFSIKFSPEIWNKIYTKVKTITVSLEDIFTILDKASFLKEYFNIYDNSELIDIQQKLNNCIIYMISSSIHRSNDFVLYEKIAKFFIKERQSVIQEQDPLSIITLNWDTLLDNHIYDACLKSTLDKNNEPTTFPDYCCYNYDLNEELPSTHLKPTGKFNIKLMKLHGSINWLLCTNCGRLITDYRYNISLQGMDKNHSLVKCKHCDNNRKNYGLKHVLITPTFLKDLNNLHLKNIWHNAYLDLSEASEVIFIGYSLPDADFELRYILKKALRPDVKIKVILHSSDNPKVLNANLNGLDDKSKKVISNKLNYPEYRYKIFFKNHKISFSYKGIENYFK